MIENPPLYTDSLIAIKDNGILFKNHYFFWHSMRELIKLALKEDIGKGDITGNLITDKKVTAKIIAGEDCILSGIEVAKRVFSSPSTTFLIKKKDGTKVWTQFWPNGIMKSESTWYHFRAQGSAKRWNVQGELISDEFFWSGRMQ